MAEDVINSNPTPPNPEKYIFLTGGSNPDGLTDTIKCEILTPNGQRQKDYFVPDLPKSVSFSAVVSNEESVYVICANKEVYKLSTARLQWSRCKSMPRSCYFHTAAMPDHDYIIVIDGDSNAVLIYDTTKDAWHAGPSLPIRSGVRKAAVVNYNGGIVCSGGLQKVKPCGEVPTKLVWMLKLVLGAGGWIAMPPMVKPRHSHAMAVVSRTLYVIGGNEYPCDVEVLTSDGFQLSITMVLPIAKYQPSAIVYNDTIVLPPGLSTAKDEDTLHEPPGQWVDDSLIVVTPNSADITTGTVRMKTVLMDQVYHHGSHGVMIAIPSNPTDTLHSLLTKLEHLPPTMDETEKRQIKRILDDLLQEPSSVFLVKTNLTGSITSFIRHILYKIFKAVLAGVNFDLVVSVLDRIVAYFRTVQSEVSYSFVAEALLDYSFCSPFALSPDKYLAFLQYLLSREATLSSQSVWCLISSKEKNRIPQIHALTTQPLQYLRLLQCCHTLVQNNANNVCRIVRVRQCHQQGKLKKVLYTISQMNLDQSPLNLIYWVLKDHLIKEFCANVGLDLRCLDTCDNLQRVPKQICQIVWQGDSLKCLKCNKNEGATRICNHPDVQYAKTLRNLKHMSDDYCMMDSAEGNKISAGILRLLECISAYLTEKVSPLFQFSVSMIGSVAEGTKVGRYDEFDVQIHLDKLSEIIKDAQISYHGNAHVNLDKTTALKACFKKGKFDPHAFGQLLDERIREALRKMDFNWNSVPFRIVGTSHPWQLMYTEEGNYNGMMIFADLIPILVLPTSVTSKYDHAEHNNYQPRKMMERAGKLLQDPALPNVQFWLKWAKPEQKHRWCCNLSQIERETMQCLPKYMRDGFKRVKLLLQIEYWENGGHYSGTQPVITSYIIKNALFWLLYKDIKNGVVPKLQPESALTNGNATLFAIRLLEYLISEAQEKLSFKAFLIPSLFLYKQSYIAGIIAKCEKMLDVINDDQQCVHF